MNGMNEGMHQEALFNWANWNINRYPELKFMFHTPNGGKRDAKTATILKREGVKAGVPDIILPVSRMGYHGLFIELKVGNNKTTDKQDEWIKFLTEQGYLTAICYHWQFAADLIEGYLKEDFMVGEDLPIIKKDTKKLDFCGGNAK